MDEVQNAYAILLRRADQIGPNQAWLFLNQLSHLAQDLETSELKIQLIKVLCTMLFEVSFSLYQPLLKEAQQLCAGHQELNEHLRSQVSRSRECIDRAQIATLWLMDGELPEQQCSQL